MKTAAGRPTKYRPEMLLQAEKLCRLGAIDRDLADFFGVNVATLNRWKRSRPGFRASLTRGKLAADAEVADALYRRAVGCSTPAVEPFIHRGRIVRAGTVRRHPPDVAACIFWLKNRRPAAWCARPAGPPPDATSLIEAGDGRPGSPDDQAGTGPASITESSDTNSDSR